MIRPVSALRRAPLIAALATGAAMLAAGCSVGSPPAPATGTTPIPSASSGSVSAPAASPSSAASVSPSAPPSGSLPAGWQSCANSAQGFEIGYPARWHTAELNQEQACQQFHPTPFTIPIDSEYPLTALNAVSTQEAFDPITSGAGDPAYFATLLREPTAVGGRQAVRFEESDKGAGLNREGTMRYGYVIDRDGREFTVFTIAAPGVPAGEYGDWKVVVDQAVETLRFE
jgi:hypothetical protein